MRNETVVSAYLLRNARQGDVGISEGLARLMVGEGSMPSAIMAFGLVMHRERAERGA